MTDADRRRIAGISSPKAGGSPESYIVEIVDAASEELLAVVLSRFGVNPGFADELLAEMKKVIDKALRSSSLIEEYLKDARGPFGIPGGGVF